MPVPAAVAVIVEWRVLRRVIDGADEVGGAVEDTGGGVTSSGAGGESTGHVVVASDECVPSETVSASPRVWAVAAKFAGVSVPAVVWPRVKSEVTP